MSFTAKLSAEGLAFFNETASKPFNEQACAFLNAYWVEVGDQAEFIFGCAWENIKETEMHSLGVSYVHQYVEGINLDFDMGLYFYEKLCKNLETGGLQGKYKGFNAKEYKISQPEMVTAIVRKKELREKVDVNFDGRVSFLEYLLYQYRSVASPSDFVQRSLRNPVDPEAIRKARAALEEVTKAIKAYEAEKARLEAGSLLPGVKGLKFKNMLAQLNAGPLWEHLSMCLIKAEAAVRIAIRGGPVAAGDKPPAIEGSKWWLSRDLAEKKKRYGGRK